ncbi:MAG TPA: ABC transporter ATP-binding protein [Sporichthyaceae bacterium]|jgi:branched-chain amino acid transport system ATP-binding protein|nr:ABC transporter ATP-binding protein [Sporichthyaceae bacterium]
MSGHLIGTGMTKRYAGLVANDNIDVEVRPGEIVGLIGPNGAGKTTLFNCLTGAQKLTAGRIKLNGKDITAMPAADRARLGLSRTFQQSQLFRHLSVEENLLLGRHRNYGAGSLLGAIGLAGRAERAARGVVATIAEQCGLIDVLAAPVGDLPYGTQRMVEVARAIVMNPEVLLVDEPAAGMDSTESEYFGALLRRISREREMSVLIIEHDVAMVLGICDRVYVLNFGKLLATGSPADIRANAEVRAAYLGSTVTG